MGASCRQALAVHGYHAELPSGAKAFIHPEQYEAVQEATESQQLRPWHVLVAKEFEGVVTETVKSLPSRSQVRERQRSAIQYINRYCEHCAQADPKFKCSHCEGTWYCSKVCQRRDWRFHKAQNATGFELPIVVKHTFIHLEIPTSLCSSASASGC